MKVEVLIVLPHPDDLRMKLLPGEYDKEVLLQDFGRINYDFALKEGWMEEIVEKGVL